MTTSLASIVPERDRCLPVDEAFVSMLPQAGLMRGRVVEATYCAGELLQKVVDRGPVLDEVVRILRTAEGQDQALWGPVRARFEQLEEDGG